MSPPHLPGSGRNRSHFKNDADRMFKRFGLVLKEFFSVIGPAKSKNVHSDIVRGGQTTRYASRLFHAPLNPFLLAKDR